MVMTPLLAAFYIIAILALLLVGYPYYRGYKAGMAGNPRTENPWAWYHPEHRFWEDGWFRGTLNSRWKKKENL